MKPELVCACGDRIRIENTPESAARSKWWRAQHRGHTLADRTYVPNADHSP